MLRASIPLRHRASSTSLSPALTLQNLQPRSTAPAAEPPATPLFLVPSPDKPPQSDQSSIDGSSSFSSPLSSSSSSPLTTPLSSSPPAAAMAPVLVSRSLQLFRALRRVPSKKRSSDFLETPIDSPRSSLDSEYILPLAAAPTAAAAVLIPAHASTPSAHARTLFMVLLIFPISTAVTFLALSSLPVTAEWPRTLADLARLGGQLSTYASSGTWPRLHILAVLSISAVWKHAWSIPGSVLWNVLAGALFHPILATILMTVLTTIGSLFSSALAMPLAPLLTRFFPKPIALTRKALEGTSNDDSTSSTSNSHRTSAWTRLSVLRLIGLVPWSALNIACGVTGVSFRDCALGALVGTLPWTAVTCQIGDILQTFASEGANGEDGRTVSSLLASPQIIVELVVLSVLSLAPVLGRERLARLVSPASQDVSPEPEMSSLGPIITTHLHAEPDELESDASSGSTTTTLREWDEDDEKYIPPSSWTAFEDEVALKEGFSDGFSYDSDDLTRFASQTTQYMPFTSNSTSATTTSATTKSLTRISELLRHWL